MPRALAMALFTFIWIIAVALPTEPSADALSSAVASAWLARTADSSKSVRSTASGTEISYRRETERERNRQTKKQKDLVRGRIGIELSKN